MFVITMARHGEIEQDEAIVTDSAVVREGQDFKFKLVDKVKIYCQVRYSGIKQPILTYLGTYLYQTGDHITPGYT